MIMAYRECSDGVGYNNFEDSNRQLIIHQLIDLGFIGLGLTHCVGCPSFVRDAVVSDCILVYYSSVVCDGIMTVSSSIVLCLFFISDAVGTLICISFFTVVDIRKCEN